MQQVLRSAAPRPWKLADAVPVVGPIAKPVVKSAKHVTTSIQPAVTETKKTFIP